MQTAIRLFGENANNPELIAAIRLEFQVEGVTISVGDYEDCVLDPVVEQCDALVCFVGSEDNEAAVNFLLRAIKYHAAYVYLTTIVIGDIQAWDEETLKLLGASRYLPSSISIAEICQAIRHTIQKTWWHGVRQLNVSAVILNAKRYIVRANEYAKHQFSAVEGQLYDEAIERNDSRELPRDHPVVKAWRESRVNTGDRLLATVRGGQRFYLLCTPLHSVKVRPNCVAVLMIEMSRSEEIIRASADLAGANTIKDICPLIAQQVRRLGMERVRVYQYLPNDNSLILRAVEGYSYERKLQLLDKKKPFQIDVQADDPTKDTMQRSLPRLYVRSGSPRESSDLECYFTDGPLYTEELGKENVNRWIEAPLLLPRIENDEAPRFWGKLSIDRGPFLSDHLSGRDVDDVVLLSILIMNALAAVHRLETERSDRAIVRRASAEVVAALSRGQPLEKAISVILDMFRQLTQADIVLYREYDKEALQSLRLVGDPEPAEQISVVPRELPGTVIDSIFPYLGKPVSDEIRPIIVSEPHLGCQAILRHFGAELSEQQDNYLRSIRSELHIPIVRQDVVQGVIIAVSRMENAFTNDAVTVTERLIYVVSGWIELAKQQSVQLWAEKALGAAIQSLSLLADVPLDDDKRFFAGLAAILTSHLGLKWNRCIAFACNNSAARSAEMVYALGGRVDDQEQHKVLQKNLSEDSRLINLESLVAHRISNVDPACVSGTLGISHRDSLYDLCITDVKEPLVEYYGGSLGRDSSHDYPIQQLLAPADDALRADGMTTRFMVIQPKNGKASVWIRDMNEKYPGIFNPEKTVYAFSLWSVCNQFQEPLGVVLLDSQHKTDVPRESMISATHVLLGLAGDVLATRKMSRRLGGLNRAVPAIFHGRDLKMVWDEFVSVFRGPLLAQSQIPGSACSDEKRMAVSDLLEFVEGSMDDSRLARLLGELHGKIHRIFGDSYPHPTISDLGAFLAVLVRRESRAEIRVKSDNVNNLALDCDPSVLSDVLNTLLENSERAGERQPDLTIEIEATIKDGPTNQNFERFVSIIVRDNGQGIRPELVRYLGIKGVTSKQGALHHGQGLAIARGLLMEFCGKLEYVGAGYPELPIGHQGVLFEIIFGIDKRRRQANLNVSRKVQGTSHESATHS